MVHELYLDVDLSQTRCFVFFFRRADLNNLRQTFFATSGELSKKVSIYQKKSISVSVVYYQVFTRLQGTPSSEAFSAFA